MKIYSKSENFESTKKLRNFESTKNGNFKNSEMRKF